jgi:hypothetical protein
MSRFNGQFAAWAGLGGGFELPLNCFGIAWRAAGRHRPFPQIPSKGGGKSLWHRPFLPYIDAIENPAIWSFASPGGFVIRSRLANDRFALFLGSSAVEHSTVNRMVAGSNPARGANHINDLARNRPRR